MTRDEAKSRIREDIPCTDYLKKSKHGMYKCPRGVHGNETGAVKYYPETNTWFCHQCHDGGDVIDLMQIMDGISYNDALRAGAERLGISIDANSTPYDHTKRTQTKEIAEPEEADYTEYYRECRARLREPEAISYLQARGISYETASAYWLGYDPAADPAP